MNINFQAFRWNCNCSALPLKDFLMGCAQLNGQQFNNRILYFIEGDDVWKGLTLTIKDMKKFTKIVNSSGEVRLDVHKLEKNEHVADFNFFIVDKDNGCGMYQHYHNSCSLNIFNAINRDRYLKIKESLHKKARQSFEEEKIPKREMENLLRAFNETMTYSIIEKSGSFIERVAQMDSAREAEIEFDLIEIGDNEFVASAPHMRRLKYHLFFEKDSASKAVIRWLVKTFNGARLKKAKVIGIDENGTDATYRLVNDFDRFGSFDYESMVPALKLDQDKIKESIETNLIISKLIATYKKIKPVLTC